jgi:cytochrome P450
MIDPYPLHATLRDLGPVVRLRKYDCWGVTRYEGEAIAELEGEILLTELARSVRGIAAVSEPTVHLNNSLRSFAHIPLRLTAA